MMAAYQEDVQSVLEQFVENGRLAYKSSISSLDDDLENKHTLWTIYTNNKAFFHYHV